MNIYNIIRCACLPAVLSVMLSGCGRQSVYGDALREAESKVDFAPDSACEILSAIPRDELLTADERDRYALLAVCAGYGDSDSLRPSVRDSLIDVMAERHSDDDLSVISRQAKGMCYMSKKNYPMAMREFLQAERMATDRDDYRKAGKLRLLMKEINDSVYNKHGVRELGLLAFKAFEQCRDSSMMYEVSKNLVDEFIEINDFENAELFLEKMKSCSSVIRDSVELFHVGMLESWLNVKQEYLGKEDADGYVHFGSRLFNSIKQMDADAPIVLPDTLEGITEIRLHRMVTDLWRDGEQEKACRLIDAAVERFSHTRFKGLRYITVGVGDTKKRESYEVPSRMSFMRLFQTDVNAEVRNFDYIENQVGRSALRFQRQIFVLSMLLLLTVILFGAYYFSMKFKRQRRREAKVMDMAEELNRNLRKTQSKFFMTISNLCDIYYNSYVKNSGPSKAGKEALKAIEKFSKSADTFVELEEYLDLTDAGLMARFREQMPGLRDDEYKLFLCNALGLSVPTITLLLDEKREVIYNRRQRLRAKIQSVAPPDMDRFVERLG